MSHFKPHIVSSYLHCETISHKITTTITRVVIKRGIFTVVIKLLRKVLKITWKSPWKIIEKFSLHFQEFSCFFSLFFHHIHLVHDKVSEDEVNSIQNVPRCTSQLQWMRNVFFLLLNEVVWWMRGWKRRKENVQLHYEM